MFLCYVAERWVAKIMSEGRSFARIGIDARFLSFPLLRSGKVLSDSPRDLSDLEGVGQPVVVGVSLLGRDYLRYPAESRKG